MIFHSQQSYKQKLNIIKHTHFLPPIHTALIKVSSNCTDKIAKRKKKNDTRDVSSIMMVCRGSVIMSLKRPQLQAGVFLMTLSLIITLTFQRANTHLCVNLYS